MKRWSALLLIVVLAGCDEPTQTALVAAEGVIVRVDRVGQTATLAYTNEDGERVEVEGRASSQCHVTIDGRLAELGEIADGDNALIVGTLEPDGTVTATIVHVTRPRSLGEWFDLPLLRRPLESLIPAAPINDRPRATQPSSRPPATAPSS